MRSTKGIVAVIASLTVATQVQAALITELVFVQSVDLLGSDGVDDHDVYDLIITTDTDWTNSRLDMVLTQGSFYQDSFGDDRPPNPAFFSIAPTLEFDTYFAGADRADTNFAGQVGTPQRTITDTVLGISWFDNNLNIGAGTFQIARITVTQDAVGSFTGKSFSLENAGLGQSFSGSLPIPEPASLALMMVGGMMLLKRQRRRQSMN